MVNVFFGWFDLKQSELRGSARSPGLRALRIKYNQTC